MSFIDEAVIHVQGGSGGNGCVAFRREKFVPRGGPSGGDGGHGGSVYLVGETGRNTLHHLRFGAVYKAERGRHGEGSNKTGRSGEDLVIPVPLGTVVTNDDTGAHLGEVLEAGERLVVAQGGRGGRGNARFTSPTHRAPRESEPGGTGDELRVRLELKLLADVGIVGLPNAGKSTLISVISAATPRVADYPFTTLVPQLGVVAEDAVADPFVVADLPGLISGAAEGAGLGHQFLRHVERCRILVHLVDLSDGEEGAAEELDVIEREMAAFDPELMRRDRLIVGSKLDSVAEERRKELAAAAAARDLMYLEISSVTRKGVESLVRELRRRLSEEATA